MHRLDQGLKSLMDQARERGFLTYQMVHKYLPDEGGEAAMIEQIILALEELQLPLINDPDAPRTIADKIRAEQKHAHVEAPDLTRGLIEPETPMSSRDPIRMYLSQMGNIPLLSRDDEIFLAKQIEITRKRYRRAMMESDFALATAVDILEKVQTGELPFERTLRTSDTENTHKDQILGRMPHNLPTLKFLLAENRKDWELSGMNRCRRRTAMRRRSG